MAQAVFESNLGAVLKTTQERIEMRILKATNERLYNGVMRKLTTN